MGQAPKQFNFEQCEIEFRQFSIPFWDQNCECKISKEGDLEKDKVKSVIGVQREPESSQIFYLCTWEQTYEDEYIEPCWAESMVLNHHKYDSLILRFYEKMASH